MKHKLKFSDIGRTTYFHHEYGVVFRKKRGKISALYASSMLVVIGGFFVVTQLAIPTVSRHLHSLQNQKPAVTQANPLMEQKTNDSNLPEIKQDNEELSALVKDKIATFGAGSEWAVFAYDLEEGNVVKINTDKEFESASLYKLFLVEALENKLPFDKWQKTRLADKSTVKDCVEAMLRTTDSACAEEIGKFVGWDVIDELNKKNGFASTKVAGNTGRTTTAADTGELLTRLKKGQMLSDKTRRFVFDALYQQVNTKGMTLGCNGCRAADKLGESSSVAHDVGIVTHGTRSYVLVIMSRGGTFDQIAELTRTIDGRGN